MVKNVILSTHEGWSSLPQNPVSAQFHQVPKTHANDLCNCTLEILILIHQLLCLASSASALIIISIGIMPEMQNSKWKMFYLLQDFGSRFWRLTIAAQSRLSRMLREKTPTWTGCTPSRARRPQNPIQNVLMAVCIWETIRSIASSTNRDQPLFVRFQYIFLINNNDTWVVFCQNSDDNRGMISMNWLKNCHNPQIKCYDTKTHFGQNMLFSCHLTDQ